MGWGGEGGCLERSGGEVKEGFGMGGDLGGKRGGGLCDCGGVVDRGRGGRGV